MLYFFRKNYVLDKYLEKYQKNNTQLINEFFLILINKIYNKIVFLIKKFYEIMLLNSLYICIFIKSVYVILLIMVSLFRKKIILYKSKAKEHFSENAYFYIFYKLLHA